MLNLIKKSTPGGTSDWTPGGEIGDRARFTYLETALRPNCNGDWVACDIPLLPLPLPLQPILQINQPNKIQQRLPQPLQLVHRQTLNSNADFIR